MNLNVKTTYNWFLNWGVTIHQKTHDRIVISCFDIAKDDTNSHLISFCKEATGIIGFLCTYGV